MAEKRSLHVAVFHSLRLKEVRKLIHSLGFEGRSCTFSPFTNGNVLGQKHLLFSQATNIIQLTSKRDGKFFVLQKKASHWTAHGI